VEAESGCASLTVRHRASFWIDPATSPAASWRPTATPCSRFRQALSDRYWRSGLDILIDLLPAGRFPILARLEGSGSAD